MFSADHIQQMKSTATMKNRDLHKLGQEFNSIYINNQSFKSALLAAGSCFNAVDHIMTGQVAIPPQFQTRANTSMFLWAEIQVRYDDDRVAAHLTCI